MIPGHMVVAPPARPAQRAADTVLALRVLHHRCVMYAASAERADRASLTTKQARLQRLAIAEARFADTLHRLVDHIEPPAMSIFSSRGLALLREGGAGK